MPAFPPECKDLPTAQQEILQDFYDNRLIKITGHTGTRKRKKASSALKNYLKRLQYFGAYESDEIQWVDDLENAQIAHQASVKNATLDESRELAQKSIQSTAELHGRLGALTSVEKNVRNLILQMKDSFFTPQDCANAADDAAQAAAWIVVGDLQLEPSPFEPLLQIWEHGFWPIGPLAGKFVIYAPSDEAMTQKSPPSLPKTQPEQLSPPEQSQSEIPQSNEILAHHSHLPEEPVPSGDGWNIPLTWGETGDNLDSASAEQLPSPGQTGELFSSAQVATVAGKIASQNSNYNDPMTNPQPLQPMYPQATIQSQPPSLDTPQNTIQQPNPMPPQQPIQQQAPQQPPQQQAPQQPMQQQAPQQPMRQQVPQQPVSLSRDQHSDPLSEEEFVNPSSNSSKTGLIIFLLIIVLGGGGGSWWYINSNSPEAFYKRAQGLMLQGKFFQAISIIEQALKKKPNLPNANSSLGSCYFHLKQENKAVQAYQKAVLLNPTDSLALRNLGILLKRQERLDEAKRHLLQASTLRPKDPYVWYNLGHIQARLKQANKAIRNLKKAIRLQTKFPEAYNDLGAIYLRQALALVALSATTRDISPQALQFIEKSKRLFFKAINQKKSALYYRNLGDAQILHSLPLKNEALQQQELSAMQSYTSARSFSPNQPFLLNNLAVLFLKQAQYDKAIPLLKLAVSKFNELNNKKENEETKKALSSALYNLAVSLEGMKLHAVAIEQYKQYLRFVPQDGDAYCRIAKLYRLIHKRKLSSLFSRRCRKFSKP